MKSLGGYYVASGEEVQFIVILNGATADAFLSVWTDLGDTLLAANNGPTADSLAPSP